MRFKIYCKNIFAIRVSTRRKSFFVNDITGTLLADHSKKKPFDVNSFNKSKIEESKSHKKLSREQKEKERRMKIVHGSERISKWMENLDRPKNCLNIKNFGVDDSSFDQSNMSSNLSKRESVNFDLENFDSDDSRKTDALFDDLGIDRSQTKKNPEDEKIIFPMSEDLKRMNISFKNKRREWNQFIKMDPFGKIVFDQSRFYSRKQFTDMNVLGIPTSGWENIENEENQITYSELISNCLNTLEYADDLGISKEEMISNLIEEINWRFPTELNLQKDLIDQIEILLLYSHIRTDAQIESFYVTETDQYLATDLDFAKEKLVEMLLHCYKVIFKTQSEILKNKEAINVDEQIILIDDSMITKMEIFMDQFLSTFQDVNFDIIVDLPRLMSMKDLSQTFDEKEFEAIEDVFLTILKKREERKKSENILLMTKSTMREENKKVLENLIEHFPAKNFYLMEVPYLKRRGKKLKKHELRNIDYVRRMERKQEFHFHHFFTLLGGAISNDALMVINDSFVDLFPKVKQWEANTLWENNIYERFMSTRFCGKEATEEIVALKNELGEEYFSATFRNKILLDLIPRLKGFDLSRISDSNILSEDRIHRVPQIQMNTIYFPFVDIDKRAKKETMKWAIFEPHGHSF